MVEMNESKERVQQNDNENAEQGEKGGLSTVMTGRLGGKEDAFWWKKEQMQNRKKKTNKTLVGELRKTRATRKGK